MTPSPSQKPLCRAPPTRHPLNGLMGPKADDAYLSAQTMTNMNKDLFIDLAGGRIRCRRCQAQSKRSGEQCKKPALKGKAVCGFHGGKSTGPRTREGRQRIASTRTIHGGETRAKRRERSASDARMRNFEDLIHVLGMTTAPRWRGRKPNGYVAITTVEQAKAWIVADILRLQHKVKL